MSEWVERPLGQLAKFQKGRKVETSEYLQEGFDAYLGAPSLEKGNVEGFASTNLAVLANPNDVLMLWDGERSGLVGHGLSGVVSSTVSRITSGNEITGSYLYYHLLSRFEWIQGRRTGTGVPHVPKDLSRILKVNFPCNIDEQERITKVLASVGVAIERTEALIEKYQQIKAGLMHDLFTRGIGADGKLRPPREQAPELYQQTPIGWIPKEWGVLPVEKTLTRIIDYRGKTPDKTVAGIPLITAKNVRMGYIDSEPMEFIAEDDYVRWMTRGIPNKGDVLFTTEAPLGNVAQVNTDDRVAFAQRVIILQPTDQFEPSIIAYRLMTNSTQNAIARLASGSTALGIKQSEFRKVLLGLPFRQSEQRQIIKRLAAMDKQIICELENMDKLNKQKAGLMHDLLTGKVRIKLNEPSPEMAGG